MKVKESMRICNQEGEKVYGFLKWSRFLFELVMPVMDKENEQCVKCEWRRRLVYNMHGEGEICHGDRCLISITVLLNGDHLSFLLSHNAQIMYVILYIMQMQSILVVVLQNFHEIRQFSPNMTKTKLIVVVNVLELAYLQRKRLIFIESQYRSNTSASAYSIEHGLHTINSYIIVQTIIPMVWK